MDTMLLQHINQRIIRLLPQCDRARSIYLRTKDESWGKAMVDYQGRIDELLTIKNKITRYNELHKI